MVTAEEVVKSLPGLLREHPELRTEICKILSDEFVIRSEFYEYMKKSDERFERLLQELKAFREDTNRRFEAADKRFEALDKRFEEMREDMNRRFEAADKRFDAIDKRFEEVYRRFEVIDKRFEEVYRRFEVIDKRFEEVYRRFEVIDKRFEEVYRRFEAMDKRFEEVYHRFDKVDRDFKDLKDWVGIVVGGFQRRAGRSLEDAVAGTLRIALGREVKPENIMMRKKITDDEGLIGPKGRSYEIDLCVTDTESLIFEIKSYAEEEDIERFNDKAELAIKKLGLKKVQKALITLEKRPLVMELCDKFGILVG
ncbi:MAG: hypothetical protein C4B56_06645 [Candidatus Methanophagaceae archaeon]|nr:MAG: hypothetical protein C4B56_06645 [Methanophagales archaeon]